jgi:hypothetical protein
MEGLLNEYGWAAFGPVLVLLALPLMVVGMLLRNRGRKRAGVVALASTSRRKIGDVSAGLVAIEGRWRGLDGGRGIVEDPDAPERRVLVERAADAPPLADGADVAVIGMAVRQVDDPRGTGYRGPSRVWVIEAPGGEHRAQAGGGFERAARAARALSTAGAALFAAGLLVALATCVIAYRASQDEGVQTTQVE